ncbi:hypothetical protein E2C01_060368 [Portunus trituberculatus]|uniref:Uncharacterized protein n=1 Tax=Portunus trituberculatus TaxID=210409 RepID=A0A5B7H0Z2_PORTR|nr:hypothetical protein [Portunus trituberculatus]
MHLNSPSQPRWKLRRWWRAGGRIKPTRRGLTQPGRRHHRHQQQDTRREPVLRHQLLALASPPPPPPLPPPPPPPPPPVPLCVSPLPGLSLSFPSSPSSSHPYPPYLQLRPRRQGTERSPLSLPHRTLPSTPPRAPAAKKSSPLRRLVVGVILPVAQSHLHDSRPADWIFSLMARMG